MSCEQYVGNPLCCGCILLDGCCDWGFFEAKTSSAPPEDTSRRPGERGQEKVSSAVEMPGLYVALRAPLGTGIERE